MSARGGTGSALPSLPGRRAPSCAASGGVFLRPRWGGPGPRNRHCRGAGARRRAPLQAAFFCVRAGDRVRATVIAGAPRRAAVRRFARRFLRPRWGGPGLRYRHCRGAGARRSAPFRAAFFTSARRDRVCATVIAVGAAARRINFKKCVNALREEPDLRGGYHHSAFFARSFFHLYKFGLSTNNIFENTADRKRSLKNIFDLEETE